MLSTGSVVTEDVLIILLDSVPDDYGRIFDVTLYSYFVLIKSNIMLLVKVPFKHPGVNLLSCMALY